MIISDIQIASLAKAQGLSDQNAAIATAVALGESGGNTTAHNPRPPDDSYGLWQINMLEPLGTGRRRQFGIASNDRLFEPQINARAMAVISSGGVNWRPWSVFTNGSYTRFLPRGNAAVQAISSPSATRVSPSLPLTPLLLAGALGIASLWYFQSGRRKFRIA